MPPDPLEPWAFGPSVHKAARLLYHENPPTSKLNETPALNMYIIFHITIISFSQSEAVFCYPDIM